MPLSPGSRIGTYEIVAPLGAGGMGEVYRAKDSKLKREVALKVLPADVANDRERMARFQREAEVLASLNHPHIAQIYGLEENALVMELVEGEDLAERLKRGAIPIDEALPIAKQIAEALEAAHEQGIIHRDLKPANITVRPDGTVKVLDFGLAKAMGAAEPEGSALPATITSPAMTMRGMILGTAAYMSPEQARGKAVDKRADIWAFGGVLYEMLTGRQAFGGDTITDVLSAVVRAEPDWASLPASAPPHILKLLKRCLQKDARQRLRDIGDAIAELDPAAEPMPPRAAAAPRSRRRLAIVAAMVSVSIVTAVIATAVGGYLQPAPVARVEKLHLNIGTDGGTLRQPVISPDGTKVAYVGRSRLWVRSLDQWEPRELAGTEGAVRPFWSPDSSWIGYFRSEALLKVPAGGGPVFRVATLPAVQAPLGATRGAWTEDGTIYVSLASGPLLRVPAGGGDATPFMDLPPGVALDLHDIEALPGGRSFLVVLHRTTGLDAIGVMTDGVVRPVLELEGASKPTYAAPGYVVFERRAPNAGLWAVPFAADTLTVAGDPFLIGEGADPSVARDGTLAFVPTPEDVMRRLAWFSMTGTPGGTLAEPREWVEGVAISKDQRRMLASAADGLWVYDTDTGARSRVTTDPADMTPDWVDQDTIVFVRTIAGEPNVMLKRLATGGEERMLAPRARFPRVTEDGRRVVFNLSSTRAGSTAQTWKVAWIDLDQPATVRTLPPAHDGARFPAVSPDGTMVAYVSGELGRDEIFLTSLPAGQGKWQVSDGGGWPLFHPRGDALLYRAADGSFMSVPVSGGTSIKVGQANKLFDWGPMWAPFYDVAPDGVRGVAAMPVEKMNRATGVSIVRNWHLEFARN